MEKFKFGLKKFGVVVGLCFMVTSTAKAALRVHLYDTKNFTAKERAKLNEAILYIETIINGPEFRERVLNHTYQGQKQFVQNGGQTNEQVYETIMAGAEKYPVATEADQEIDMELEMYVPKWYQSRSVLGYTYQNTRKVWINRYFFSSADANEIAGNFIHEWTHKLGFEHDYKSTSRRPFSVPYAIGYMIRDLGN